MTLVRLSRRNFVRTAAAMPMAWLASCRESEPWPGGEQIHWPAATLARAIRNGHLTSEHLVTAYLQRIDTVNQLLNAVFQVDADAARAKAKAADAALARGDELGPLHGVPFTIKDSFDTQGVVSTAGTLGRAAFIPDRDATVVARLRGAGAILLGKSNTPELTMSAETDNLVYGRTNNPYDLTRTSGGSSGGAGAIVAASGSPFDIGTDTGGSIRIPSHFCGIAGIKPTSGRVPRTGHIVSFEGAIEAMTQPGPMARSVEDLALILAVISGADWRDPSVVDMPLGDPRAVNLTDLRIAVHTDNGIFTPTAETTATVSRAADVLADGGAAVTSARPAGIEQTLTIYLNLLFADGGAWIEDLLRRAGTAQAHPALRSAIDNFRVNAGTSADFGRRLAEWDVFQGTLLAFLESHDVIVCPVTGFPAPPHGGTADDSIFPGFSYTVTYNLTGWPAAVVRCGTSPEGLPIGVQVVARPWREDVALAVAHQLEATLGGWKPARLTVGS